MLKIVDKMIESFQDELDGAKEYSEKYLENKAINNMSRAQKFKDMASDELRHASYMYEFAIQDMNELKRIYELPTEDQEHWKRALKRYAECMAWIKQTLE